MSGDTIRASKVIHAPAATIFAVIANPAKHASIDGTGWVRANTATEPLTAAGQIFRMPTYHPDHPDGNYETVNEVRVFDPPTAISWATGYDADDGAPRFGGWVWRYDLMPTGPAMTSVTLTYDWSAATETTRERIGFPPFPSDHLANSLTHLAALVPEQDQGDPGSG